MHPNVAIHQQTWLDPCRLMACTAPRLTALGRESANQERSCNHSIIPALAGILNAIHSGTNAQLNTSLSRPWWAAVIVCVISGLVVLFGALVAREGVPTLSSLKDTPWWAWLGTAIAAVPVITSLLFAGRLGGAAFNGIVVTATILCSIALDHFGIVGFSTHPVNSARVIGAVAMLGGLTLICLF